MNKAIALTLFFATTSTGCALQQDPSIDTSLFDIGGDLAPAGVAMNGPVLQGTSLNGPILNGVSLQGVNLNGVSIAGYLGQKSVLLRGGELMVAMPGTTLGGMDLAGATLPGVLSDASVIELRIDAVAPTNDAEIYKYTVSYRNGANWENLCGYQNGLPVQALAVEGRWDESSGTPTGGDHIEDPNLFTFACSNAVIAKCINMGYAPWRSVVECNGIDCHTVSMRDMHQACTRMMRADYCGNGTPHTANGTTINVWDHFGMQTIDMNLPVAWTNEAEWGPKGALCIQQVRWSGTAEDDIDEQCPKRWESPDFSCFSTISTFFTPNGFQTPALERSLLRNQFTHDPY